MANTTSILQEFETYLRDVKNRSELTIQAYVSDLSQFCLIMGISDDFKDINPMDIEARYIGNLAQSGISAASRARKLSSLKTFYRWAELKGYVVKNPVESVERPKIPHKEPRIMDEDEVQEVLFISRNAGDSLEPIFRDSAILSVMFNTGIRREEVVNIQIQDVNLKNGSILIHGKGAKDRIVYFNDSTRAVLSEYIHSHRELYKTAKDSPYLFVTRQSGHMTVCTLNNIVNRIFEQAGVKDKGYTAHSTRKVFATTVYKNTKDIVAVQRLLGHSSIATTQVYLGISEMDKKQAAMSVNF